MEAQLEASKSLAEAAKQQAEVARKAYIAADRPWIAIKALRGHVDIQPDFVLVTLTCQYTNIGKGPALRVRPEVLTLGEGYNIGVDGFPNAVEAAMFFPIGESILPGEQITIGQQFVFNGPGILERLIKDHGDKFFFQGCVGTQYYSPSSPDRFISSRLYLIAVTRISPGKHGSDALEFHETNGHFT